MYFGVLYLINLRCSVCENYFIQVLGALGIAKDVFDRRPVTFVWVLHEPSQDADGDHAVRTSESQSHVQDGTKCSGIWEGSFVVVHGFSGPITCRNKY